MSSRRAQRGLHKRLSGGALRYAAKRGRLLSASGWVCIVKPFHHSPRATSSDILCTAARKLSFPGSAWERTARAAPPRLSRGTRDRNTNTHSPGGAWPTVRSQAEPGNEEIAPLRASPALSRRRSLAPYRRVPAGYQTSRAKPRRGPLARRRVAEAALTPKILPYLASLAIALIDAVVIDGQTIRPEHRLRLIPVLQAFAHGRVRYLRRLRLRCRCRVGPARGREQPDNRTNESNAWLPRLTEHVSCSSAWASSQ